MVRVGIIGLGFGAHVHYPAFHSLAGARVVSMCGRDANRVPKILENYPELEPCSDWKTLISGPEIDAVVVAMRPCDQAEVICAILESGRHVLCEKPLGMNSVEALEVGEAAEKSSCVAAVDFQFRFHPGIQLVRELVSTGSLGRIERVDVDWLSGGRAGESFAWQNDGDRGGGVINSYLSHVFDYLCWILQSPVEKIFAASAMNRRGGGDDGKNLAEDAVDCLVRFSNGTQSCLSISNCHRYGTGHRIRVVGERGCATMVQPPFQETTNYQVSVKYERARGIEEFTQEADWDNHTQGVGQVAEHFIQAIEKSPAKHLAGIKDGVESVRYLEMVRESIKTGCWAPRSDI